MKRVLFVLLATCVLMIALAGTAFATTTSTWATWDNTAGGPNGSVAKTPHIDYATSSVKCAVCHAVHKASSSGDILLASTVGNACVYCHITSTVGVRVLYSATAGNYNGATDLANAHNDVAGATTLSATAVQCVNCHTVHGAGAMGGNIAEQILKSGGYQARLVANVAYDPDLGSKAAQETAFCTKCHPYFVDGYGQTITGGFGDATTYKSHIMKASGGAYGNGAGNSTAIVAYAGSQNCTDCHDGGTVNVVGANANSFPHFTTAPRFLMGAKNAGATPADVTNANADGVCLKCHANGDDLGTTAGVGFGF